MPTMISRLQLELDNITSKVASLIKDLPIKRLDSSGPIIHIGFPEYYWGETPTAQLKEQLEIQRQYDTWFDTFKFLFFDAPDDLNKKIDEADQLLRNWIGLGSNWSISYNRTENEERLRSDAKRFLDLLAVLEGDGSSEVILIPDTNAIIREPDPSRYQAITRCKAFVFLLIPTVLTELDSLKTNHQCNDFRKKVRKVIARIKGWRNQGHLPNGVTVSGSITVRSIAAEPNMELAPGWLNSNTPDDKIIASVFNVHTRFPSARVVLVTGDINLMNKADAAGIEASELVES